MIIGSNRSLETVILNDETKLSGLLTLMHLACEVLVIALCSRRWFINSSDTVPGSNRETNIDLGLGIDKRVFLEVSTGEITV